MSIFFAWLFLLLFSLAIVCCDSRAPLFARFILDTSRACVFSFFVVVLGMTIKGPGCSAFPTEIEWNKKGVRSLSVCLEVSGSP
jgi:hypothetical protein